MEIAERSSEKDHAMKFWSLVVCTLSIFGLNAVERADFVSGVGTEGWTMVMDNAWLSPTYANSVSQISVECTASEPEGSIAIYARSPGGTELQIATFTATTTAATFAFENSTDFRAFRLVSGGGMLVSTFTAMLAPALRAIPISGIEGKSYVQSFDTLASVTSTPGGKDWVSGISLPCWQAWKGRAAISVFSYNGGKIRTGGLYALAADIKDDTRALGGYSTKDAAVCWGTAFTNDTDAVVRLANVSYLAQQWGFANTNEQRFVCSFMVTNRLDWIVNCQEGWVDCCEVGAKRFSDDEPHSVPVVTQVSYAPETLPRIEPGEVVMFRWMLQSPTSGYSAMMAIDDLTVTFSRETKPFAIHFVDGK